MNVRVAVEQRGGRQVGVLGREPGQRRPRSARRSRAASAASPRPWRGRSCRRCRRSRRGPAGGASAARSSPRPRAPPTARPAQPCSRSSSTALSRMPAPVSITQNFSMPRACSATATQRSAMHVVDDREPGLGDVELVAQELALVVGVDRHLDEAADRGAPPGADELRGVDGHEHDAVALPGTGGVDAARDALGRSPAPRRRSRSRPPRGGRGRRRRAARRRGGAARG